MIDYQSSKPFLTEKERIVGQFTRVGVPAEQAEIVADCFATADIFGVTSHGAALLPAYVERITSGAFNLNPSFRVVKETAAFAVLDGDNALGPVSAAYCLQYAMEKAKTSGVFSLFSSHNNTFGPAFYYSLKAAEQGMIAFVTSNSPAQMAPMGGKEKLLGTNPFSVVIPVRNGDPVIVDMATSVVAKSKFREYQEQGKRLPEGWALDSAGNPTTDPKEGMKGFVLPMAGFKGYGIALLIDYLAGFLSGAAWLNHVGRFYSEKKEGMNVGFLIHVIDPHIVFGEDYDDKIAAYINEIRNSRSVDGNTIVLPGDDRWLYLKKQL